MKPNLTSNIFLLNLKKRNNKIITENRITQNTLFFNFLYFSFLLLILVFLIYLYKDKKRRTIRKKINEELKKKKK